MDKIKIESHVVLRVLFYFILLIHNTSGWLPSSMFNGAILNHGYDTRSRNLNREFLAEYSTKGCTKKFSIFLSGN
jgi:hypothetical protein